MNIHIRNLFLLPALIASFSLILAGRVSARTFTPLHTFTNTNSDGMSPNAGLLLSGNTLYGTTIYGGSAANGSVFRVNTDGTAFTNLHSFTLTSGSASTNKDGANPYAGLILSGNTLYGAAFAGGFAGNGTVFAVNTDGLAFTNLHNFTALAAGLNTDGAGPLAGLFLSGNLLYGTAGSGGSSGNGTFFKVTTDGTGFTPLRSFATTNGNGPNAGLLSGNTLYGTVPFGGSSGNGTVFRINTDGLGFTNLHNFAGGTGGRVPNPGLVLLGNTLYGTAAAGGNSAKGTVFAVNTDGSDFTNLYHFTATAGANSTNSDGAVPADGLILSGNTLYGTAQHGGNAGNGTVFAVNTDGTHFTNLYSFSALIAGFNSDGTTPEAGLVLAANTLYGTAMNGGGSGDGTVFSLSLGAVNEPLLAILRAGTNVIVTWPTNATGFTLQSTTNLAAPVWVTVTGQNTVTNPISGTQKLYRLSQ